MEQKTSMKPYKREAGIERYLVEQVKKHGGRCHKWVSPGYTGVPDRIVMFTPNIKEFVETKAPKGRLRARQIQVRRDLAKLGISVHVLKTKEEVKTWVELQASIAMKIKEKAIREWIESCSKPSPRTNAIIDNITAFKESGL